MAHIRLDNDGKHTAEQRDPETRRRILTVAVRLFEAKGFKGVSMKDIAEEVQVTAAALYYYFPEGKQELFVCMFQQLMQDWSAQVFDTVSQAQTLDEKLFIIANHWLTHEFSHFMELGRDLREFCSDASKKDLMRSGQRLLMQKVTSIFQQAIDADEVRSDVSAMVMASMFTGLPMSLQMGRRFNAEGFSQLDSSHMARLIVDSFLYGVSATKKE